MPSELGEEVAKKLGDEALQFVLGAIKDINFSTIIELLQKNQNTAIDKNIKYGQQTMAELNAHNKKLEQISIPGKDLKAFKSELKNYGVDFAIVKNEKDVVSVFFKGQDVERIQGALKNTLEKVAKKQQAKQRAAERFNKAKAKAAEHNSKQQAKTKNKVHQQSK